MNEYEGHDSSIDEIAAASRNLSSLLNWPRLQNMHALDRQNNGAHRSNFGGARFKQPNRSCTVQKISKSC